MSPCLYVRRVRKESLHALISFDEDEGLSSVELNFGVFQLLL